jgi:tetratricopeptide (TPR) repeat protein
MVEVVPAGSVHTTIQALQSSTVPIVGRDIVEALAQKTEAGIIVTGSYYLRGDALRFQVQIADRQQGNLLAAIDPVSGSQDQPLDGIDRLRQQVMGAVASHIDPGHEIVKVSSQPPSFEAYQLFIKGEETFVNGDMRGAIELFEPISEKSPTFLGHVPLLAMAYYNSGRWAEAKAVIHDLSERLDELSPHDVHKVEYLQARIEGDHAKALHAARHAAELDPDFTWLEGLSALRLNRILEARDAFTRLNRGYADTPRLRQWTPYWHHHSRTLHMLGEHEEELEIAKEGRQYRPEAPLRVFSEVRALVGLGRVTEAMQLLDENLALPDTPSPLWPPGRLIMETSLELQAHGHLESAEALLERALAWYRSRPPSEAKNEGIRSYYAQTLFMAGYPEEAEAIFRELSDENPDDIVYRGGLGVLAACLGDHESARETMDYLRNLNRPHLFGHHYYWQAAIAAHLGERQRAVDLLREGFVQGLPYLGVYSRGLHLPVDLATLKDYAPFQELMRPKYHPGS